ncbi:MAG: hypothetical protein NTX79_05405 [Candidatus Micrarchaeota archaeon]|nr:hypothetical protein [Candidatus Micrarchaeota archaeon]
MGLSDSFKSTCRVLFGQEIGELSGYKNYLLDMVDQPSLATSALSGKPIHLSRPHYAKSARFVDVSEASAPSAAGALSINDIKDVDSALAALSEKMAYCGNKNLGRSMDVLESDMCQDSMYVLSSQNVIESKHVAYCNGIRQSENTYGCQLGGEVGFSIHSQVFFYSTRCFDAYLCVKSSDLYSCFNCKNSFDAMFCFNQNSARCAIGNLQLPKEKYIELKKKLLSEIAQELEAKKRFPSIFEAAGGA